MRLRPYGIVAAALDNVLWIVNTCQIGENRTEARTVKFL
eukprot:SAG31_NODE_1796_length_7245_cov_57.374195_5_plen_39_part_00